MSKTMKILCWVGGSLAGLILISVAIGMIMMAKGKASEDDLVALKAEVGAKAAQSEIVAVKADVTKVADRVTANDTLLAGLRTDVDKHTSDINIVATATAALKTKVATNDTLLAGLRTDVDANKAGLAALTTVVNGKADASKVDTIDALLGVRIVKGKTVSRLDSLGFKIKKLDGRVKALECLDGDTADGCVTADGNQVIELKVK